MFVGQKPCSQLYFASGSWGRAAVLGLCVEDKVGNKEVPDVPHSPQMGRLGLTDHIFHVIEFLLQVSYYYCNLLSLNDLDNGYLDLRLGGLVAAIIGDVLLAPRSQMRMARMSHATAPLR